jgi:hypothetical protein
MIIHTVKKFPALLESDCSLPCSQESTSEHYAEPDKSSHNPSPNLFHMNFINTVVLGLKARIL